MRIHCKYTGIKGFLTVYEYGLKYQYMITEKAKIKAKILIFWEKHGLKAALDAFPYKTLNHEMTLLSLKVIQEGSH